MFVAAGQPVNVFDLPAMDFSGLEGRDGVQIFKGDVTDSRDVRIATRTASAVVHLAALLPPNSERDRDLTFRVNVDGTRRVVEALVESNPDAMLVFTSSISTYGDTADEEPPIRVGHPQRAIDIYADSKIAGETVLRESGLKNTVVLRIAGIAVPAFLEPPDPWPFMEEQRVEMVHRDDVVDALFNAARTPEAAGKVLHIAGGDTWQLRGRNYACDFYDFMGAPAEEATYMGTPGWMDWYDTEESNRILKYQSRSYEHYSDQMRALVQAMMADC
jgi:nucleoside-diphosphate-sugar epimerase